MTRVERRVEDDEVGVGEAGGVALPVGESGDVVCFAGHVSLGEISQGGVTVMPGSGPHRFYFVGKPPWVFWVPAALLFLNSVLGLLCFPLYEHFTRRSLSAPVAIWLEGHFISTQFTMLGLIGLVLVIYRKDVRYEYRGWKRK